MLSPQICDRPDNPSTLLTRNPPGFGTLLGRIFSRLPGLALSGTSRDSETVPSVFPDEILINIVSFCVRRFSISIRKDYHNVPLKFEYSMQDTSYRQPERYYVDGFSESNDIKLVNCLFYDAVWTELAKEFNGCLEVHLPYANREESVTRINQLLSVPIGKLSWLTQQITHLRLLSQTSYEILPDLDLRYLPKLERVYLDRMPWRFDEFTYTRELCREPGDRLDRRVVSNFGLRARYQWQFLATLRALKKSPIKIFLEYDVQEAGYGDIVMYLFELDVTDYPNVAITSRTEVPFYCSERWER